MHVAEGFRLSSQQKRLWLWQQNSPREVVQFVVLLEGPMDGEVLKQAAQSVVDRHEILRTGFECRAGIKLPFQVVSDTVHSLWETSDWTGLGPRAQELELDGLLQVHTTFPDQGQSRFSLIALSPDKHVLVVRLSPLCTDSATMDNLMSEIRRSYEACVRQEERNSDVLQYLDYCAWMEETLDSADEDVLSGLEYWHTQDQLPALIFKLPFQSRDTRGAPGITESVRLSLITDAAALESAARQLGASPAGFLQACWLALLSRLSGQREIACGVEFTGRSYKELRDALGLFAHWLPVRARVSEVDPFTRILAGVTAALDDAEKWQDYCPDGGQFEGIGVGFGYHEMPQVADAAGVAFSIIGKRTSAGNFALQLRCVRTGGSLRAHFHYDPELFASADIERMAAQFESLLQSAIRNPASRVDRLQILTAGEREAILVGFNRTSSSSFQAGGLSYNRKAETIHERFQQQAVATPDAIAVVYENEQLSYRELETRANQLAGYLQALGVGPDALVAICVDRSLDMVVALLGVLKAGAAYIPLDAALPKQRLSVVLKDTQTRLILTQRRVAESLPDYDGRLVYLDTDWPAICKENSAGARVNGATSANLAYVLFTSGSTGVPKGVAIEHRQLLNYVDALLDQLDLPSGAGYALVSTFAADLGNTAIFPALCSGGALHIIAAARVSDPDALAEYFSGHSIDCLKIVPSHLEAMLTAAAPENVLPKRRLVVGGEAASWELLRRIEQLAPNCQVLNHYGPTESTVGAATWRAGAHLVDHRIMSAPIGKPIANAKIYILDRCLEPVPVWVAGVAEPR